MSLAQISMHYCKQNMSYNTALRYMKLVGLMEADARQLLNMLDHA